MLDEKRVIRMMELAIESAYEGMKRGDGGPFGALVCRGEEILSVAHNSVFLGCDPTAHAEITAIRQACKSLGRVHLDDCALISTCEPCPMCLGAIHWAHIPIVYFGATRGDAEAAGFIDKEIYEIFSGERTSSLQAIPIKDPSPSRALFQFWSQATIQRTY